MKNVDIISKISSFSDMVKISATYFYGFDESREPRSVALKACERFIQTADILPEDNCLCFRVEADEDGLLSAFASSGSEGTVTKEDYDWMFHRCAEAEAVSGVSGRSPFDDGRRVYALSYKEGKTSTGEHGADSEAIRYLSEAVASLRYLGAELWLIVNGRHGGRGTVLISLPEKMSVRLRTMLSLGCPDTEATEITGSDILSNKTDRLPVGCLADIMSSLFCVMIQDYSTEQMYNDMDEFLLDEEDDFEEDGFFLDDEDTNESSSDDEDTNKSSSGDEDANEPKSDQKDNNAPVPILIDDLDLSIRASIALKRAGINTVAQLRDMTDEELMNVRNLGKKCFEQIKAKLAEVPSMAAPPEKTAPSYTEMLDGLIGLDNVKEQIKRITAFARMKQDMESMDRKMDPIVLNMEFVGNPGTAKTTVARITAGILHEIGLLKSGEIVEAGRGDLIAGYIGQTAEKVKAVFREAKGKLLFIDEAYSLLDSHRGSFADEAIATIVQEMENNRRDTVVIFAGYPDKMDEFFEINPGLRSRVPFIVQFSDYNVDEMVHITENEAERRGFSVSEQAIGKIASICDSAAGNTDTGNGRFCRNLAENAILNYAMRVYGGGDESAEKDFCLTADDFEAVVEPEQTPANPIGFSA